jgi:hypothetical protein
VSVKEPVALILGYDALGGVEPAVQAVKAASLVPMLILNRTGADYTRWLSDDLVIRSNNVNRDHSALAKEIVGRVGNDRAIRVILNSQDRMWPCYLDLRASFPRATGVSPRAITRTSVKPNLRYLTKGTDLGVAYVLLSRRRVEHGTELKEPALRRLIASAGQVIVKPVMGMAGLGVTRVSDGGGLERALGQATRKALAVQTEAFGDRISVEFLELGGRRPVNEFVLVEEYIEGIEYSAEGHAGADGRAHYFVGQEKLKTVEEPCYRDLEYLAGDGSRADLERSVGKLLRTLQYRNFPFHVELKGRPGKPPRPVEFNPRVGGGSIVDLVASVHSVNLRELAYASILRRFKKGRWFATMVVQPERTGVVTGYAGLERVRQQPDCVFIKEIVPPGRRICRLDMETYLIELCVVARSDQIARERAKEMLSWITVDIR